MGSELKERVKEVLSSLECIDDYDPEDSFWEEAVKSYADDAINLIKDQQARIEELEAREGWRDISSAPKDGVEVFVWTGNAEFPSRWEASWREPTDSEFWVSGSDEPDEKETFGTEAGWFANEIYTRKLQGDDFPTHWQPLPEAPQALNTVKDDENVQILQA